VTARNVEPLLYAALVAALPQSVRVYPVIVPQDAALPCVRYAMVYAAPESSLCGSSGLVNSHMQIDVWAHDYVQVRVLRDAVIRAMQGFALENIFQSENEMYDADYKAFQRVLTYSIWEQEKL
jgi:hypothetical protein